MITIENLFSYGKLPNYKGLQSSNEVIDKDCLVGVEVELEQVQAKYTPSSWIKTQDGSLRDAGLEFVSKPLPLGYLDVELRRMFDGLTHAYPSTRCSIHIHVNVRDLTEEELYKFIMLYSIFERSLFRISGDRWKSNYCVPITSTPEVVRKFIRNPYKTWYKYLALNLAPIYGDNEQGSKRYGTVEFRHHEGCKDPDKILQWCNVLVALKKASQRFTLDEVVGHIKIMNIDSSYYNLAESIFGSWAQLITQSTTFKEDIESSITKCKFMFFDEGGSVIRFNYRGDAPKVDITTIFDNMPTVNIGTQAATATNTRVEWAADIPRIIPEMPLPTEFIGEEEETEGDF